VKKDIIKLIEKHYKQTKRCVPWTNMWDICADDIVKLIEKKMKKSEKSS
tara:strand:- start:550 stop:696 length:147 start_codon:yes stop_codon:yes gene_type:complete